MSSAVTSRSDMREAAAGSSHMVFVLYVDCAKEVIVTSEMDLTLLTTLFTLSWERNEVHAEQLPSCVVPWTTKRENVRSLELIGVVIFEITSIFF